MKEKISILVVEDEPWQGKIYQESFSKEGYTTHWVSSAEDALALCEKESFDVVILDIYLPGMDGLELLGRLRERNRDLIVILYSAYGIFKDNFLSWPADAFLEKSDDLTNLKNTVNSLLKKHGLLPLEGRN